jgi:carboxylesterase
MSVATGLPLSGPERRLLPGAEPFELPGRDALGVLLVHGFTGTPWEMRPLAEALAAEGFGSACPLLRGHGTHPDDMVGQPYAGWIADVEATLEAMLARRRRAVLVGLSMGGTLALNVAARRVGDSRLAGLVTIGAPLVLDDWRLGFTDLIVKVVKWQAWGKPDIKDRSVWDRSIAYRRVRTHAILELLALLRDTRDRLAQVDQPILVMQARDDHIVPPRNARLILDGVSSAYLQAISLENCYHVATVDYDAALVSAEVVRFVQRLGAIGDSSASSRNDPSA